MIPPAPMPPLPLPCQPSVDPTCGQPNVSPAPCRFAPLGSTEIRTLYSDQLQSIDDSSGTVDPWNPCHVFRDVDGGGVARSDDSGKTFAAMYSYPSGGDVMVADAQHLYYVSGSTPNCVQCYPVLSSTDLGGHWQQSSTGLPVVYPPSVAFGAASADIGYAFASTNLGGAVYQTSNAGRLWTPTRSQPLPALAHNGNGTAVLAVDPGDSAHAFLAFSHEVCGASYCPPALQSVTTSVWSSSDRGSHWSQSGSLDGYSLRLVATRLAGVPGSPVTLYAETETEYPGTGVIAMLFSRSVDGGTTWVPLPVPAVGSYAADDTPGPQFLSGLAFDPVEPSQGVYVVMQKPSAIQIDTTMDGFQSVASSYTLQLPAGEGIWSARVSADRFGDFFLTYAQAHLGTYYAPQTSGRQTMIAFRLPAIQAAAAVRARGAPPAGYTGAVPVVTCALSNPQLEAPGTSQGSGTLAFDGTYLDYVVDGTTAGPPAAILRIDPATCSAAPPLPLRLPAATPCASATNPSARQAIWALTYDARYVFANGRTGALLALGSGDARLTDPVFNEPIYAIDPATGDAELAAATAGPRACAPAADPTSFSYDVFSDLLWTSTPPDSSGNSGISLARLPGLRGGAVRYVPSCMDAGFPSYGFSLGANSNFTSGFVVGGDGVVYAESEDDTNVFRVDTVHCTVLDSFAHRGNSESADENDQLACDAITQGDGSKYQAQGDRSLLWIRDATPNTVSAYWIPDGYCPFPSRVSIADQTVVAGAPVDACGVLRKANPSPGAELAHEPLSLALGIAGVGQAMTDVDGRACITTRAPATPGAYPLRATFAGSRSYLPSQGVATLTVVAGPTGPTFARASGVNLPPRASALGSPLEPPAQPPQPAGDAQLQLQAVPQAQTQAQAQSQSVTQVQPGVMVQQRTREQVATQTARHAAAQDNAMLATRRERSPVAPAVELIVGALMLCLGLLARRPALARARARRRNASRFRN